MGSESVGFFKTISFSDIRGYLTHFLVQIDYNREK